MRLCLTCCRFWGEGALFCGHCGHSFGCRRCPHHHPSPPRAAFCVQCGSPQLTPAGRSVSLRPLSRILTLLLIYAGWKWLRHHFLLVVHLILGAGNWFCIQVLEINPHPVGTNLLCAGQWLALAIVVMLVIPGAVGVSLRKLLSRILVKVVKALLKWIAGGVRGGVVLLIRVLRWLIR